ncbi:hypothetical protein LCGC14_1411140 [marine sediment metagenome]|uniref:Uncharacterized protein n=1 Tax=marine sediment metagenome TaxID=412755 RepID=A0A0F9KFB6_9ZZZZ
MPRAFYKERKTLALARACDLGHEFPRRSETGRRFHVCCVRCGADVRVSLRWPVDLMGLDDPVSGKALFVECTRGGA